MDSRVHPTPADISIWCNALASERPANAAASSRSIGGSQCSTASSSAGGSRPDGPRSGSPRANRCALTASAPNREATSVRDSAANCPMVRIPIRQSGPSGTGQAGLGGELPDRQRRQKPRVFSRLHDTACTGGEDRGGQLVGYPDLTLGAGPGHCVGQPFGGLLLGPEKA